MAIRVKADIKSYSDGAVSVEVSINARDVVSLEDDQRQVSGLIDVLYALYECRFAMLSLALLALRM
jgi:hypothetical protein